MPFLLIIIIIIIIINKTPAQMEKANCLWIAFATPQAPESRKTKENTTQGSNEQLTAPLNTSAFRC